MGTDQHDARRNMSIRYANDMSREGKAAGKRVTRIVAYKEMSSRLLQ